MNNYSENSLHTMFLTPDLGLWSWENKNDAFFFNKAYMDMLGFAHNEFPFTTETFKKLLHPEDQEQVLLHLCQLINGSGLGDSFEEKFRMLTASGEYLWIIMRSFVLCRDDQGKALRACGMHINMNVFEKRLENISIEHDRMIFALEAAQDGIWDWNPKTDEVYFSPRYIAMLGYQPHEFPYVVESWSDKIHPDDLSKTIDTQRKYIESPALGDSFECVYRFMDAQGVYRWILGRGKITKRDANGVGIRVVGLHTDVTELRNAQESLVKLLHHDSLTHLYSRFYFDSILNKINSKDYPLSIIFCDLDGLKMVNDILGHTDGDKLLIDTATIVLNSIPDNGIAARLGGDEFAILLPNTTQFETNNIVNSIQQKLEQHNSDPEVLPIFMSMGIESSQHKTPIYRLLSRADEAMLKNKSQQKDFKRRLLLSRIEKRIGRKVNFFDSRFIEGNE